MRKISFFGGGMVILIVLFFGVLVDLILNDKIDFSFQRLNSEEVPYLVVGLGYVFVYWLISVTFKLSFFEIFMDRKGRVINLKWKKYRLVPTTVMFVLFLTGYIPYFTVPIMSLVIMELIYLSLVYNVVNNKEL